MIFYYAKWALRLSFILLSSQSFAQSSISESWPNRPIRIITTDPGGAADIAARLIAPSLSKSFGQPVYIDNRSGGGSITAIETVVSSAPDGHTLLLYGSPVWLMQLMKSKLPWDPIRDLSPISLVITQPNVLAVNPSLPVKNVQELIALAKQKPGELNYIWQLSYLIRWQRLKLNEFHTRVAVLH